MKLLPLIGVLAQLVPGLWFTPEPTVRGGLTEGDSICLGIPVGKLPAGTFVQFGISLENLGDKAPRHYMVEVNEGGGWRCISEPVFNDGLSDYSFVTAPQEYRHPSTYQEIFRLRKPVRDSLRVRCRVCSPYAADHTLLDASSPGNSVELKARSYVGARLQPLGNKAPGKRFKVLLVGNSFTYFYGEPFILQELAFSQGIGLDISSSLKGGQTFRDHAGLPLSLAALSAEEYDFAFLQGQSQESALFALDPAGMRDVKTALCQLCDALRATSPSCRVFVENTWAYEGAEYGGFGSMERFDALLADGCRTLATVSRSEVSPVGQAFAAARSAGAPEGLYDTDSKHPGLAGAYLKACVTCLVISGRPFKGAVPACGLPEEEASALRKIAETIVL